MMYYAMTPVPVVSSFGSVLGDGPETRRCRVVQHGYWRDSEQLERSDIPRAQRGVTDERGRPVAAREPRVQLVANEKSGEKFQARFGREITDQHGRAGREEQGAEPATRSLRGKHPASERSGVGSGVNATCRHQPAKDGVRPQHREELSRHIGGELANPATREPDPLAVRPG